MGNITNYIEEQGHLMFAERGFNEVDNLVLAQIAYIDFEGIVPSMDSNEDISVKKACEIYFAMYDDKEMQAAKTYHPASPSVLEKMALAARFKHARLSKYGSYRSKDDPEQFAALCVTLDDRTVYVAFRGTDGYLVSWQEDFNMSYRVVPSQLDAVRYLNKVLKNTPSPIRIRSWDARREQTARQPRQAFIDQVWPDMK